MLQKVLDHRAVAVEGGIVQASAFEIKAARNSIDLRTLFKQQLRGVDVAVHAGVHERVVDNALTILRPRVDAVQKSFAKGPVNTPCFGLDASVGIKVTLDQISATEPSGRANVLNLRATFEKQLIASRLFQYNASSNGVQPPVPSIAAPSIEQQFRNGSIVDAASCNEWLIQLSAGIDQDFRHLNCVRFIFAV